MVAPVDVDDALEHDDPDNDQGDKRGVAWDRRSDGDKRDHQQEENGDDERGQAGTAAGFDTGRGLDVGGHRRGAKHRTDSRADGVGHQRLVHLREFAVFIEEVA